jgi:hypothetical protein
MLQWSNDEMTHRLQPGDDCYFGTVMACIWYFDMSHPGVYDKEWKLEQTIKKRRHAASSDSSNKAMVMVHGPCTQRCG